MHAKLTRSGLSDKIGVVRESRLVNIKARRIVRESISVEDEQNDDAKQEKNDPIQLRKIPGRVRSMWSHLILLRSAFSFTRSFSWVN